MPHPFLKPTVSVVDDFISDLCKRKDLNHKEIETICHDCAGDVLSENKGIKR